MSIDEDDIGVVSVEVAQVLVGDDDSRAIFQVSKNSFPARLRREGSLLEERTRNILHDFHECV